MCHFASLAALDRHRTIAAEVEDRIVAAGPSGNIALRIVRPHHRVAALPVVMYFPGGGWVLGEKERHDRLIREIANGTNAAVVFPDCNRSLDTPSAIAIEEAYAVTKWVAFNGSALGLDPTRLAVLGDSAGGNVSAAVALLAKERGGPRISAQVLFYPITEANQGAASRSVPIASALQASVDRLHGLPPALVITSELDARRDQGETYAGQLVTAGVSVTFTRYLGVRHDFVMLNAGTGCAAAGAAIAQANAMLRRAFAS
jgi:acetyl esterase